MDKLSFNAEHYSDPTVYLALKNIEREERRKRAEERRQHRKRKHPQGIIDNKKNGEGKT